MNQDKQPSPRREFDLDQMNLHADVSVDRFQNDEPKSVQTVKVKRKSKSKELFFSAFLNLVLAGAFGFLFWERQQNQGQFQTQMNALNAEKAKIFTELQSAKARIDDLEGNNKQLHAKGQTLSEKEKQLSNRVEKEREQVQKYKNEIASLKKDLAKQEKSAKDNLNRYNSLKASSKKKETQLNEKIGSLEAQIIEKDTDFQNQRNELSRQVETLLQERKNLKLEVTRYQGQIQAEAQAGRAAMQEQGRLNNENRVLSDKVRRMESEVKTLKAQVKDLKEVTTGELVPFSTDVTLPVPHYKEPVPKQIKWPRGTDFVVVHMQITESGAVKEIYFPQGQFLDSEFQSTISPTFFKWKFSPPKYRNLNVKTWVPVVVRKQ